MNNINLLSLSSSTFGVTLVWEGVEAPSTLRSPIPDWLRHPSLVLTLRNELVRCLSFMFCKVDEFARIRRGVRFNLVSFYYGLKDTPEEDKDAILAPKWVMHYRLPFSNLYED